MTETLEIIAGRYYALYPLTKEGIELAKKFLDVVKKEQQQP